MYYQIIINVVLLPAIGLIVLYQIIFLNTINFANTTIGLFNGRIILTYYIDYIKYLLVIT